MVECYLSSFVLVFGKKILTRLWPSLSGRVCSVSMENVNCNHETYVWNLNHLYFFFVKLPLPRSRLNLEAEHGVMDLCKIKVLFVFVFIILYSHQTFDKKKSKCWHWLMGWVDSLYCSVELYVMGCGWLARATTRALSSRCDMAVIERDHQRGSTTNGRRFWTRWCCGVVGGELTVDKQSLPGWSATFCPWTRQWWWGRGLIVFAAVKMNKREPGEVKLLRGHARNTLWGDASLRWSLEW